MSEALHGLVSKTDISPSFRSDHSTPWICLCENKSKRGTGFWKLNTSLLNNKDYVEKIVSAIQSEKEKSHSSQGLLWEMIKMQVRGATIQFASRLKRERANRLEFLDKEIARLEERTTSTDNRSLDDISQNELVDLNREKSELVSYLTMSNG